MLKPLIKYTGGKFNEYKYIKNYIPMIINNYYEPFFGGGGIYFQLHNDKRIQGISHINDISESLINFYKCVSLDNFKEYLDNIEYDWELVKTFGDNFHDKYGERFIEFIFSSKNDEFINNDINVFIDNNISNIKTNLHGFSLKQRIKLSLNDKIKRFRKKNISKDEYDTFYNCIVTSICQAFYFIIRDMYNDWNNHGNIKEYNDLERATHYLFIREFCFCSMFRFNPNGDFNVPYGGNDYNKKNFRKKIDAIISSNVKEIFNKTIKTSDDFEFIINNIKVTSEYDFIFIDPPYDSTFSSYDNQPFNKNDHIRLYNTLTKCKCKWMMVIGKTEFIYNLYQKYIKCEYNKTYMYQAKGDYDNKHTNHLIITNYDI